METKNSFNKGMNEAPAGAHKAIRRDIMKALGITHRNTFYRRRTGKIKHTPAERIAISEVFKYYDINDPWGE